MCVRYTVSGMCIPLHEREVLQFCLDDWRMRGYGARYQRKRCGRIEQASSYICRQRHSDYLVKRGENAVVKRGWKVLMPARDACKMAARSGHLDNHASARPPSDEYRLFAAYACNKRNVLASLQKRLTSKKLRRRVDCEDR